MKRIYVIVEGSTEEMFVTRVLYDHLINFDIYLYPIGLDGASTYGKIKRDVLRKCKEERDAFVTTMIDYYGLPRDFPNRDNTPNSTPYAKVEYLEQSFRDDIEHHNFHPYLMLHEFEALLYSDPKAFGLLFEETIVQALLKERAAFDTPEHINNDPGSAPSKRIAKICPRYNKKTNGVIIGKEIGLNKMREECVHFDQWMKKLESWKP